MSPSHVSRNIYTHGFGLIGLVIIVALMLVFAFGVQKFSSSPEPENDTSLGTYRPIGETNMKGQLETSFQLKEKAQDTVTDIQNRAARDIAENE